MEWLSVTELSKVLEIPETTTRRHLMNFKEYFRSQKIGRGKKYHPDSVELLRRIVGLYDTDHETTDIKKILADEYAFIIEDVSNETITQPPHYDISGKLDSFQQKQDDFNKMLLKQLDEQQKYIEELIKSKNENTDELKQLTSPEEKRIERLEQIMAERKVSRILEEEALELWREKSEEERLIKEGWFRKREDTDKRDRFVKKYVDDRFEEYLKKEFDIE